MSEIKNTSYNEVEYNGVRMSEGTYQKFKKAFNGIRLDTYVIESKI